MHSISVQTERGVTRYTRRNQLNTYNSWYVYIEGSSGKNIYKNTPPARKRERARVYGNEYVV